jgi:hypothetical protein
MCRSIPLLLCIYIVCKINNGLAVSPSVHNFLYVKSQRQAVTERKYNFLNGFPLKTKILKITKLVRRGT